MNKVIKTILTIASVAAIVSSIGYFRHPYETQSAVPSEIRKTVSGSGFILRNETIITKESTGVFEPTVKDGVRVARGSTVGTLISGDLDEKLSKKLEDVTKRIEEIKQADSIADLYSSDDARIYSAIKELTSSMRSSVDENNYEKAREYKNQLISVAEKKDSAENGSARDKLLVSLEQEQYELESQIGGVRAEVKAPAAGFFYSELDGLEDYGNESTLTKLTPAEIIGFSQTMKTFERSASEIAKISDSYTWYMAAVVSDEEAKSLEAGKQVRISIDEQAPVSATVLTNTPDGSGGSAIILKSNVSIKGIIEKRTVGYEIENEYYKGLKVPAEAMRITDGVTGVYVISDNGSVAFKCVDILCQEDDCYIVRSKYTPPEDTTYSPLKLYDNILVNPEAVKDGKNLGKSKKYS